MLIIKLCVRFVSHIIHTDISFYFYNVYQILKKDKTIDTLCM